MILLTHNMNNNCLNIIRTLIRRENDCESPHWEIQLIDFATALTQKAFISLQTHHDLFHFMFNCFCVSGIKRAVQISISSSALKLIHQRKN